MRDFDHFYVQFSFVNHKKYKRYKNNAFSMKNMRVFRLNV